MKLSLAAVIIALVTMSMASDWQTDFSKAKEQAKKEHKYLLLNFSGSDWCLPCGRTRKEIFEDKSFSSFAASNLVLVNADFPRLKKNRLSDAQTKENEALADQYDKQGAFPLTILFDSEGKIVKQWVGFPAENATKFIEQIKAVEQHN